MDQQTRFRILKKGYDRFAVDETIASLENELEQIKKKLEVYQRQSDQAQQEMIVMKQKYTTLVNELIVKENAADDIARLALREANVMIERAGDHADMIIKEALATAKTLLSELVRIASEAQDSKVQLKGKLDEIAQLIENLELPQAKPFEWIIKDKEQDNNSSE